MPSKEISVTITTPRSVLNFKVTPKSTVEYLFELLSKTLREIWYFGLQYDSRGRQKYAKLKKKISACDHSNSHQVNFRLRVRCYPEDVGDLIEEITQNYFYHDVKEQIISGEIYCPSEAALLLASYQAVVRHGSYNPELHKSGYLNVPKFIPNHVLETHNFTEAEWESKIAALHKEHGDMMEQDAILEYLKIAQDLDMYGIRYFPIKNKKNTQLWMGVGTFGLNIYDYDNKLKGIVNFQWAEIHRLKYDRTKFTVKPRDSNASDIVCYCESLADCKEIMSTCSANLVLYLRRTRGDDSIEVQQMKAMAKERRQAREAERERLIAERAAREEAERRLMNMQRALQEQEQALEKSQAALSDYQRRVYDLEEMEAEARARADMLAMQQRQDEMNEQMKRHSIACGDDGNEHEVTRKTSDVEESEVQLPEGLSLDEQIRDARTATDKDYAKHMAQLRKDLDAARNAEKLNKVDIIYEDNVRQGVDKFRTLRQIRMGNTKKRVEQFECL